MEKLPFGMGTKPEEGKLGLQEVVVDKFFLR